MSRLSMIGMVALLLLPPGAQAQTKWDIAAVTGLFAGHAPEPEVRAYQEDWFHAAQAGVVIGRHLSPHLKVEAEATVTADGTQYIQRFVALPGYPNHPVSAEARKSVRSLATAVTWQFLENQWIHPYIQAGVSADLDRRFVRTWPQDVYTADPSRGGTLTRIPETVDGPHTTTAVRAVVGGGAKMYVSPRLFIRAEGRTSFGHRQQHVAFRAGVGVDF